MVVISRELTKSVFQNSLVLSHFVHNHVLQREESLVCCRDNLDHSAERFELVKKRANILIARG